MNENLPRVVMVGGRFGGLPGVQGSSLGSARADLRVTSDLAHVGSRKQLASGMIDNTPANMRLWLKSPQHIKPGALMPDFNFTDEQLDQLSAYLSTLR